MQGDRGSGLVFSEPDMATFLAQYLPTCGLELPNNLFPMHGLNFISKKIDYTSLVCMC